MYIVNNKVRISYTFKDGKVVFSDGKVAIPSVDNIDVKKAYLGAIKPVEPPIIINPPKVRELDNNALASLKDVENENFTLKPGIYTRQCNLSNLKNVNIDGLGKVEFQTGRRAIQFDGGRFSGVGLMGVGFRDINDYVMDFWGQGNVKYTGQPGSFIDGFVLRNVTAENCGTIFHIDGGIKDGSQYGLIKGLVIDGLKFVNSPEPRSVVYVGNGQGYDISNCMVDHINYTSEIEGGAHNGIFQMGGNGKFHHNRITNHQGNAIRAWLHSQDSKTPLGVEINNNIVFNSTRYGAFEIQPKDTDVSGFNPAYAKVYNNTAGRLNTGFINGKEKYYEGQMLDIYGGKIVSLEYYNNLGFEMNRKSGKITDMINNNGDVVFLRNSGNLYYEQWKDAVGNLTSFTSLHAGVGAS